MARPTKSQWDFGELFPPESIQPGRKTLTVTELTGQIRRLLEQQVGQVWVTGEITNLKLQSSGHIYFTLKDASAQLSCVLFRGEPQVDRSLAQDGRKVTLGGSLTVYEVRGQYQLRVTAVELEGLGALQVAFEKLKLKLKAEGLFATERKRPLPRYPQQVGVVTSPTSAAIRDVLHVIRRRNPALEIILAPCRVQGEGAGLEIAAAIRLLNDFDTVSRKPVSRVGQGRELPGHGLDLILVTRGGGSLEDLWAFNEEIVARAIFNSSVPVVSAVGHEIDFTISDFVADLRAATPSAAAELITEGIFSSCQFVAEAGGRLRQLVRQNLEDTQNALAQRLQRLVRLHPRRRLENGLQHLDDVHTSLGRCVAQGLRHWRLASSNLSERLARVRPSQLLKQRREVFQLAEQRLNEQIRHRLQDVGNRLSSLSVRLRLLGPEQVLARGYSITMDAETGQVLRDATAARRGQRLRSLLKLGEVRSRVE